jgi:hypothetical protein
MMNMMVTEWDNLVIFVLRMQHSLLTNGELCPRESHDDL